MHVSNVAAHKCFIGFDFARELFNRSLAHSFADSMKHEPSGLLAHSEIAANLVRGNAVLASTNHPDRRQPFAELNRRVFHNSSRFSAELPLASLALPNPASANERVLLALTAWAGRLAIGPTELCEELKRSVFVAEIQHGHLKSFGKFAVN